jgi:hypothetical protein
MIVNKLTDYNRLVELASTNTGIVAVVPSHTNVHPCVSTISFVYYMFDNGESFILGDTHPDTVSRFPLVIPDNGYVLDKKSALHLLKVEKLFDLQSLFFAHNIEFPSVDSFLTPWAQQTINSFSDTPNIPLTHVVSLTLWNKIYDVYAKELFNIVLSNINNAPIMQNTVPATMLNNIASTFSIIERNGLYVNVEKFEKMFGHTTNLVRNNKVYSNYNLFTSTGRPSNAYKGVNFAALNKSDGTREIFESRFGDDGLLVQIDFDAYHLRLLANTSGLIMPDGSLHEELAKQYFGTENITDEQYEEGKKMTFHLLYGTITPDQNFPYLLQSIHSQRIALWEYYKRNGYIETRYSGRKLVVPEPSINKVFNYYVQALESEVTYSMLYKLVPEANEKGLLPILYTYDSVLFDIQKDRLPELLDLINNKIDSKKYPFTVATGTNYNNLRDL